MKKLSKPQNRGHSLFSLEPLEERQLLSTATTTTLSFSTPNPVMGQNVTFTATVTPAKQRATPLTGGTVRFLNGTTLLGKATLNANGKARFSEYNFYKGSDPITAKYVASTVYSASASAATTLTVAKGTFSTGSDGLKIDNISTGSGPAVAQDDAVEVNYTGYLTNGFEFDSSLNPGRTPLPFVVEQSPEQVVTGFDEGVVGMQVGGVRTLVLPYIAGANPPLGYGNNPPSGSNIPDGATLTFIVQMVSIAQPELMVTGSNSTAIASGEAPNATDGTDFGIVSVGSPSSTTTITLGPGNNAALAFTETPYLVLGGADTEDFSVTQPTIANGSATFTITFDPTATGLRTANISIFTNDATNPTYHVKIQGTGD
ncbi:MAG: FKBP-type peptidyl-prolyl cis-trans isomerase [Tepidisphaeraceae bacterium]|jgi:FKBP-type peptidyl-prolyl cis-trans isomerase